MDEPLTPELVLAGYQAGIFPMGHGDAVYWFSPDPRCIFDLDRFQVPRTVRQLVQRRIFEVRINTVFDRVIAACADRPEGTWITPPLIRVYKTLHQQGWAHCVETWKQGRLAGGLYGVAIGGAFFGESMFHHVPNASKVALVALMERLRQRGFVLADTQWSTPHLARFGAVEIPRGEYLQRVQAAMQRRCRFSDSPQG